MDWGPKAALWDFTESGQQRRSGFGGVDQRDCKEAAQVPSGVGRLVKRPKSAEASGVGASGRSNNKGAAAATCAVDGCISDLSLCRDYHRRHKVCEEHAKTPVVLVGGKQQRFCQQCSRFHLLVEFDEGKRSCRKRLDCHNRRRRKPQHPLVYSSGLLPDYRYHQGQRFVPYPPDASLAARQKRDWGSAVQHNEQGCIPNFGSFNPNNHSAGPVGTYQHVQQHETKHQQFPSPQNNGTAIMTESPAAAAENTVHVGCSVPSSKPFPQRMNSFCHDHDAPSLLSSSTSTSSMQASSILVPHIVPIAADPVPPTFQPHPHPHPHPHALLPRLGSLDKFAGLQQDAGAVSFTGISYLDADISDAAAILVPDTGSSDFSSIPIFDAGADGSSDGTSQDLPFIWR